ncbi:MAG: hypothetical protein ACUVX8_00150 [Candidatus Zipacnadales bacterium]
MSKGLIVDSLKTHYQVLGLAENVTLVRRQIEEAYEKRARECEQRLAKLDPASEEAEGLRHRLAQLKAARAVLLPRKSRAQYAEQLQKVRAAERELAEATRKDKGRKQGDSSAVLLLHLRQQVERRREALQRLHEEHYRRYGYDNGSGNGTVVGVDGASPEPTKRRVARLGEHAAALAELAARRPLKRY